VSEVQHQPRTLRHRERRDQREQGSVDGDGYPDIPIKTRRLLRPAAMMNAPGGEQPPWRSTTDAAPRSIANGLIAVGQKRMITKRSA